VTRVTDAAERVVERIVEATSGAAVELAEAINSVADEPAADITGGATPLSGGRQDGAGKAPWALLNLLLAIAGIALFAAFLLFMPRRAKRGGIDEGGRGADGRKAKRSPLWHVALLIPAAAGAALFVLTEDTSARMAMADRHTLAQALIFLAGLILAAICAATGRRRKGEEEAAEESLVYTEALQGK
jgi:hypothetical protein